MTTINPTEVKVNVNVSRGTNGLSAKTKINFTNKGRLVFSTYKSGKETITTAYYCTVEKDGIFETEKRTLFEDFSRTLRKHGAVRLTEKKVEQLHTETINDYLSGVLSLIVEQYGELELCDENKN